METSSSSTSSSLVSRAKTAFHLAAAKAEKVITEIKADLKSDRGENEGQTLKGSRRLSENDLGRADPSNKSNEEISDRESISEQDSANTSNKLTIPPAYVIKQLAAAFESAKNFNSMMDLLSLDGDPSPIKEKIGLNFSVVKSIVRREKEDKSIFKSVNEEHQSMIHTLFESEDSRRRNEGETLPTASFSKDVHGAPPESFIIRLSEMIGGFKSLQKMASFWGHVVVELRGLWAEGRPIPHMPLDTNPDLNSCHLHQQLQVINCCIARKHRHVLATELLDAVLKEANLDNGDSADHPAQFSSNNMLYAQISSGEYVLRLGADHPSESLTMLETGEPIYSPITQEGPILTEELIKETEELVLRTGSVGAGCSQLLSDMQAFKAANPGCVLEDFIRWHSPPDWTDMETDGQVNDSSNAEGSSRRGRLSARMRKEGNLWRELWESTKPLPAIKQVPLYDEDLAVDGILSALEDILPCELFEQLFISVLCAGFLIAEATLSGESNLSKLFNDCKDYVIATCQSGISSEITGDICKVYETIETIAIHPEEAIKIMEQPEEPVSGESKSLFRKINLNFITKDKQLLRRKASKDEKPDSKDEKKPEEKQNMFTNLFDKKTDSKDEKKQEEEQNRFTNLFDKKSSLFSRKQPKPNQVPCSEPDSLDGGGE